MTNKNSTTQKKQKTKDLRKNIRKEAKKFCGQKILHAVFRHGVSISNRNIKEILNQPHKHFDKKNLAILELDKLFQQSIYLGSLKKQHPGDYFTSFLFKTTIENEDSWIIVRKYDTTPQYYLYCISDSDSLMQYIVKTLQGLTWNCNPRYSHREFQCCKNNKNLKNNNKTIKNHENF
ncbi:MAG: hypothetical protein IKZ52_00935 [Bacteroidales bacterium]|nr:hypothetical protein [Bacteroidales bacterium]